MCKYVYQQSHYHNIDCLFVVMFGFKQPCRRCVKYNILWNLSTVIFVLKMFTVVNSFIYSPKWRGKFFE